jgi:hypothetical protein
MQIIFGKILYWKNKNYYFIQIIMKNNYFLLRAFLVLSLFFILNNTKTYAQPFTEQTKTQLSGAYSSSTCWGDYDNDGDLDLLATGSGADAIYKNNGNNSFTRQEHFITSAGNLNKAIWGDYNNDGYLDICCSSFDNNGIKYARIYKNMGDGTFSVQTNINLSLNGACSIEWGDYDNDGDLDLIISGQNCNLRGYTTKIFRNNGNDNFSEQRGILFPDIGGYYSAFGDYNNDGYLDVVITGWNTIENKRVTYVYRNTGNNTFSRQVGINLPGISNLGILLWGDYDNDGYLDILLSGYSDSGNITEIFKNNRNNNFVEQTSIHFSGIGLATMGDYDGDGDLDVLFSGEHVTSKYVTEVYINNGECNISENKIITISSLIKGSITWVDYNNDGKLDFYLAGSDNSHNVYSKLYKNEISTKKNLPISPSNLVSKVDNANVSLSWDAIDQDSIAKKLYTFNVRVGTAPGKGDIVASNSSANGYRKIVAMGNAGSDTFFVLKNLNKGTYYWSVQAIDYGYAGGPFSQEGSFTVESVSQASALTAIDMSGDNTLLMWTRGNMEKCIVFVREDEGTGLPLNNTTYTANDSLKKGSQISSSGWYCVYNGIGDSVRVKNLIPNKKYSAMVFEYAGTKGNEQYLTYSNNNSISFRTLLLFKENKSMILPKFESGKSAWCDYDNDGNMDLMLDKLYHSNSYHELTKELSDTILNSTYGSTNWQDFNNDGYLDLIVSGNYSTHIYINNGNRSFTELMKTSIPGVINSSVATGDYDNDGDIDVLLIGYSNNNQRITKLYRNNGNNKFTEQKYFSSVETVDNSSVSFIDYDNDGDLDILLTGLNDKNAISYIYRNNGDNSFSKQSDISFTGLYNCSINMGDFDGDGDLDLLLSGQDSESSCVTKIYLNNGNNGFTEQTEINLPGVSSGTANFVDFNNDGLLDILLIGSNCAVIYLNNGNDDFTELFKTPFLPIENSSTSFADYDNDGDIDILISALDATKTRVTKIYQNDLAVPNTPPSKPDGLRSITNGADVVFSWNPATDNSTNSKSLTYNIRVGSTPGGFDIVAPQSLPNGFRSIVAIGNCELDTFFILKNLKKGKYYWSVQAIDNNYSGGSFSIENSFEISSYCQASAVQSAEVKPTSASLLWTRGTMSNCIVFAKEGIGMATPKDLVTYLSNNTMYKGSQINNSGWFCVYKGVVDTISINGLKADTKYSVQVFEYDGATGVEQYLLKDSLKNMHSFTTQISRFSIQSIPTALDCNSAEWVDIDNDGDLDIFTTGYSNDFNKTISKIIKNDGKGNYTDQSNIIDVTYGEMAWGDYNNDGYIDLLVKTMVAGYNESYYCLKIYKNSGNNSFIEQTDINLLGKMVESFAWCDLDNDGDLDIIVAGSAFTKIYRNDKNNNFTDINENNLAQFSYSSISCGDFDNDADFDILLTGNTSDNKINAKLFRNDGNFNFTEIADDGLKGVQFGKVSWIDYDNDGYLDLIITGYNNSIIIKLFRNNKNSSFSEVLNLPFTAPINNAYSFGDCNNDGKSDILIVSRTIWDHRSYPKLFLNLENNEFLEQTNSLLSNSESSNLKLGDYDNDGDLDILSIESTLKIYKNETATINSKPGVPNKLSNNVNIADVSLKWNSSTDNTTPAKALSYNVKVGTKSGGVDIVSPQSNVSGYGNIVSMGNCQLDTTFILRNLRKGTYYWSVQAIDNGFASSSFSKEDTFKIEKAVQSSNLTLKQLNTKALIRWNRGNLDKCVVFVKEGKGSFIPTNGTMYISNDSLYENNIVENKDWYCIYNGIKDSVWLKGLISSTIYSFEVFEYEGTPGNEIYHTDTSTLNRVVFVTDSAIQANSMKAIVNGTEVNLSWIRGNLPKCIVFIKEGIGNAFPVDSTNYIASSILSMGSQIESSGWYCVYNGIGTKVLVTKLKSNTSYTAEVFEYEIVNKQINYILLHTTGNKVLFTTEYAVSASFTKLNQTGLSGSYPFHTPSIDYDNDGDLDIFFSGSSKSVMYRNDNFNYIEQLLSGIPPSVNGISLWADYNNDNNLDLLLDGIEESEQTDSKNIELFSYSEDNNYTLKTVYPDFENPQCGDFNNDGLIDVALIKDYGVEACIEIYRNYSNNLFSLKNNILLPKIYPGFLSCADYNNDGYLDLFVSGEKVSFVDDGVTYKIVSSMFFKNNGDNTFTEQNNFSTAGILSSADWGDYNNDGYLDILLSGETDSTFKTFVLQNNGNCMFTEQSFMLQGSIDAHAKWGDYNNDGYLDIFVTGSNFSKLYKNENGKSFVEESGIKFPKMNNNNGDWCDYNGDNNLDILYNYVDTSIVNAIYRNDINKVHSKVLPPSNLSNDVLNENVILKWDAPQSDSMQQKAVTFNVRMGTQPGGCDIVSPNSLSNGKRKLLGMGNAQLNKMFKLKNLKKGKYYWSVQSVDYGFVGSEFAIEKTFTVIGNSNINNLAEAALEVYPNPTSDYLYLNTTETIKSLQVFDVFGRLVLEKELKSSSRLDVSNLEPGFYTIKANNNLNSFIKK